MSVHMTNNFLSPNGYVAIGVNKDAFRNYGLNEVSSPTLKKVDI